LSYTIIHVKYSYVCVHTIRYLRSRYPTLKFSYASTFTGWDITVAGGFTAPELDVVEHVASAYVEGLQNGYATANKDAARLINLKYRAVG
jgi:hypothetical protein